MSNISEAFVAFDTSKLRNAVAIADAGRTGEVRFLGEIENTEAAIAKFVRKQRRSSAKASSTISRRGWMARRRRPARSGSGSRMAPSSISAARAKPAIRLTPHVPPRPISTISRLATGTIRCRWALPFGTPERPNPIAPEARSRARRCSLRLPDRAQRLRSRRSWPVRIVGSRA
jgi:hypothetical protein